MRLSNKQLAKKFWELISKSPNKNLTNKQIAAYLVSTRRTKDLSAITREVAALRAKLTGTVEITATSRFPLHFDAKRAVADLFEATDAIYDEKIDPRTLGGARFESLDQRLDISLKSRLDKFITAASETK